MAVAIKTVVLHPGTPAARKRVSKYDTQVNLNGTGGARLGTIPNQPDSV